MSFLSDCVPAKRLEPKILWPHSRSGVRLRVMLDDLTCCENTTPIVGATPNSVVPPDSTHILDLLDRQPSDALVIACGKQAETALTALWRGPLLVVPHPAHRLLQDDLYRQARSMIAANFAGRAALRQGRNRVLIEPGDATWQYAST